MRIKNLRDRLVIAASIVIVVAMVVLWFSPAVDDSNHPLLNGSPSASTSVMQATNSGYYLISDNRNSVIDVWINYSVNVGSDISIGNNVTINSPSGTVQVNVSGQMVQLLMVINESPSTGGANISNVNYTFPPPDPPFVQAYPKYPTNYAAMLVVMTIEVYALSIYSIAQIVALFGEVVVTEDGYLVAFQPELTVVLPAITAAIAVDFAYLYGYALAYDYLSIYIDVGGSVGTQWFNFFHIGAYGEEGVFTGDYNDQASGYYVPLLTTGGGSSYNVHADVWNPGAEPPW